MRFNKGEVAALCRVPVVADETVWHFCCLQALLGGIGQGYCENTNATGCGYMYIKGEAGNCANPKTKLRLINSGGFAVFQVSIDKHRGQCQVCNAGRAGVTAFMPCICVGEAAG